MALIRIMSAVALAVAVIVVREVRARRRRQSSLANKPTAKVALQRHVALVHDVGSKTGPSQLPPLLKVLRSTLARADTFEAGAFGPVPPQLV